MRYRLSMLFGLAAALTLTAARAGPVLMISIDGLRPADVIDAGKRGNHVPNLRALMAAGAYATGVKNVLPTVTYPNHTTLITGTYPTVHGIAGNVVFDPLQKNQSGWYWYASDIKSQTLWDAAHKSGAKVASVSWPVSVGALSIDYDIPEYWRARTADDLKLLKALSTPGLIDEVEATPGVTLAEMFGETPQADDARARITERIIAAKHPQRTTLHLVSLDHFEHENGPGSVEAKATLEAIDTTLGHVFSAARAAEPDVTIAIVSDHGFAPLEHEVNLLAQFIGAGLITLDPKTKKIMDWQAMPWASGGATAVYIAHPDDKQIYGKVALLLKQLARQKELGIDRVITADAIAKMGGTRDAAFFINFKLGYDMGRDANAPPVSPAMQKGTHGWFPDVPEMRASLFIAGPSVKRHGSLGTIDMRAIAPTLAKILDVPFSGAQAKPLF